MPRPSDSGSSSNAALGSPEVQYRLLMENVTDSGIILLDDQGRVIAWNAGAERLFGYRQDEILGRAAACLYTPDDRQQGVPEQERKAAEEGRAGDDRVLVRKDGCPVRISGALAALRNRQGRLLGFARVCREQNSRRAGQGRSGEDAGPCRVLVVDDNRDSADSLAMLLKAWGHDVRVAYDGLRAIEVARDFIPEVVLLDIGLPGVSGYEVAVWLRGMPVLDKALLVAVTAYGQEEDRRRTRQAGFDAHLVKPASPEALKALVRQSRVGR